MDFLEEVEIKGLGLPARTVARIRMAFGAGEKGASCTGVRLAVMRSATSFSLKRAGVPAFLAHTQVPGTG